MPLSQALRRRRGEHDPLSSHREEHAAARAGPWRPARAGRRVPRRRTRARSRSIERYGSDTAHAYMDELQSTRRASDARARSRHFRTGEYTLRRLDRRRRRRTRAACVSRSRCAIAGDELSIDFTETAPQVDASINCPVGLVFAACYCAIKGIAEREIPNCEGYMRPIRITRAGGHHRQSGATCSVWCTRSRRLPRLRRGDGRAGAR